jgi:hypothetical protein
MSEPRTRAFHRLGRFAGYLWATPTTFAAWAVFLGPGWVLGQLRPRRWHDGVWEWAVVPRTLLWRVYSEPGWRGTTLGYCVFYSPGAEDDARVVTHERRHVWQALWLGPFYFPVYALLFVFTGYRRHPMERDAVRAESRRPTR